MSKSVWAQRRPCLHRVAHKYAATNPGLVLGRAFVPPALMYHWIRSCDLSYAFSKALSSAACRAAIICSGSKKPFSSTCSLAVGTPLNPKTVRKFVGTCGRCTMLKAGAPKAGIIHIDVACNVCKGARDLKWSQCGGTRQPLVTSKFLPSTSDARSTPTKVLSFGMPGPCLK